MLGKRTRPAIIRKISDPKMITSGRLGYPETVTSPKCSPQFRIVSPRSLKNSDGIGLGIVVALEKSGDVQTIKNPLEVSKESRSIPIPTSGSAKVHTKCRKPIEEMEKLECMESYTCVTSRIPNKSFSKVYYGEEDGGVGHERSGYDEMNWKNTSVFYESPPRVVEPVMAFPRLDFLSSCYLCKKKLHGVDIYMYRGEKAFCSTDCRCRQITIDERKEKCGSELSRSLDVSSSPYARENIFFTGIIAT
ncbi:hypothetical protein ACHQM5_030886 [Ranunculus cassubicifolius]